MCLGADRVASSSCRVDLCSFDTVIAVDIAGGSSAGRRSPASDMFAVQKQAGTFMAGCLLYHHCCSFALSTKCVQLRGKPNLPKACRRQPTYQQYTVVYALAKGIYVCCGCIGCPSLSLRLLDPLIVSWYYYKYI